MIGELCPNGTMAKLAKLKEQNKLLRLEVKHLDKELRRMTHEKRWWERKYLKLKGERGWCA